MEREPGMERVRVSGLERELEPAPGLEMVPAMELVPALELVPERERHSWQSDPRRLIIPAELTVFSFSLFSFLL